MWLPTWQDGFQKHNNNHNILHLQSVCTFSFVVTEAEVATAATLFEEASWAANMESGSRPSKVSALAWIKLSGSAANDALDGLGDVAFNFLSGLSILCKKKEIFELN